MREILDEMIPAVGGLPVLATVERDAELDALSSAILRAGGGTGGVVLVEGPVGIGKSRLLDEARGLAERRRLVSVEARGGELEQAYSWGVVLQLFEAHLSELDPAARRSALQGPASLIERLFDGSAEGPLVGAQQEFAVVHALYWLVVNLSEQRPLVLVVDDLHWVDEPSRRFLLYLAERIAGLPVLLVGAVRTPMSLQAAEFLGRLSRTSQLPPLRPAELSLDATRRLLADAALPAAAHPDAVAASHRITGGSPLLVRELIVQLLLDPELAHSTDAAAIEGAAPRSLESRVLPRITSAGEHALELARAAAIIGDASLASVAAAAGLRVDEAVDVCARLMDAGILRHADPPVLSHPMVRSVVVAAIPPGERMALHAHAAAALRARGGSKEQVARHLLQGGTVVEAWAAEAMRDAARSAASRGAPEAAIQLLTHAANGEVDDQLRASILVDLGLLEAATGQTASLERFETALKVLEDEQQEHRALYALGQTLHRYGRHRESAATFRRGADRFAESDPAVAMHFEAAWACVVAQFAEQGPSGRKRLAALARGIPVDGPLTEAHQSVLAALALHSATATPPASSGARLAELALEGDVLVRAQRLQGVPVSLAVVALFLTERFDHADRTVKLLLDDARARHDALSYAGGSMIRAHLRLAQGRIVEAIADAEAALQGIEFGWGDSPQYVHVALAEGFLERGDVASAREILATADNSEGSDLVSDALRLGARARLRLVEGDLSGALSDCDANRAALEAAGMTNPNLGVWRPLVAEVHRRRGDLDRARAVLDDELGLAEMWDLPNRRGAALRARATVLPDAEARRDLELSMEVLAADGTPLERARTQLALGRLKHRAGELDGARELLRLALATAHTCGASVLERDARQALVDAGGRPRRAAIEGVGALTPSERRIAELAADGRSNRDIAEALFLTKNTVEWHLRNIFKKLEVRSRGQLGARLAGDDEPPG